MLAWFAEHVATDASWAGGAGAVDDQLCRFAPVLPQRQYLLSIRGG
jgi:hypothetical protein